MGKIGGFILDIILALVIIFLAGTIYYGLRMESVMKSFGTEVSDDFVEAAKKNGYITPEEYETLLKKISLTDALYDVNLKHEYTVYEPEYRFRSLQEVIEEQDNSYTGTNVYTYVPVTTTKPTVEDPVNNGNLNTETNESILASAINTPALASHVHSKDCYTGHRHTDGPGITSSSTQHGCYTTPTSSNRSCTGTYQLESSNSYSKPYSCASCGDKYTDTGTFYNYQCNSCGGSAGNGTTNAFTWTCGCGRTTVTNPGNRGTITSGSSCNRTLSNTVYTCSLTEDTLPDCNLIVIMIHPTHAVQTVALNDPLITTVTATYLDGSTKVVLASSDFSTASVVSNRTVILTYTYYIDGVSYTKTCEITVTVIPRSKTCVNGHSYHLKSDGGDPGCPYCKAWVSSLSFLHPASPPFVITIGTSMQENGLRILATYLDGHTETLTGGYVDNLDKRYLGSQLVTIGYKGVLTTLQVQTVRAKIICSICGSAYELYPDGTDPGCPICMEKVPVFTGNIMKHENAEYTEPILEELYQKDIYDFHHGDRITVKISNKSSSLGRRLLGMIFPSLSERWFSYINMESIKIN